MDIPWYALLAIVGVICGVALTAWQSHLQSRKDVARIQAEALGGELSARLDSIDARLAAIERTLTEIPS
ncbi:hypothetical protein ICW40_17225 [Actinotalea ferrariae]|uniref:hypothetical protein n=1 Tax=Actinotalea ferrariae TaxID=1386098 RepID=UPI001C8C6AC5|nr:hypothetical protein [Actinotalea ferrariae]MBX9246536.1 hypothetical protein [Actinotalea ferrariae]